jgi:hypothetical protein
MGQKIDADASPEKRLFISLITRDIPLTAAFLDLIDNSVNAAVEPASSHLSTADDYMKLWLDENVRPTVRIDVTVTKTSIAIKDDATGISAKTAAEHVFKFGRSADESNDSDRLSVYGIGMKRALFKLGNNIKMRSDHPDGGFDMKLDVARWAADRTLPWKFEIETRIPSALGKTGTDIQVTSLYEETTRRISDGLFLGQLKDAISKTYAFYMAKFVDIYLNDEKVEGISIELGGNHETETFNRGTVSCAVTAGLGIPQGGTFRDKSAGWFVFCNGRAVVSSDKSMLTGWGGGASALPIFQPKHRAFTGTVFFVSRDAESLPWTTTKAGINEDSSIWQEAKLVMARVGRKVVHFLDTRYTEEGTEISTQELSAAAGVRTSVISAAVSPRQSFTPPTRPKPTYIKIQYDARVDDVKRIAHHLGRSSLGGAEVGRLTFDYYLKNSVGEK